VTPVGARWRRGPASRALPAQAAGRTSPQAAAGDLRKPNCPGRAWDELRTCRRWQLCSWRCAR